MIDMKVMTSLTSFFSSLGRTSAQSQIHEFLINRHYLQLIKAGQKTIEGRVNKKQYSKIKINDIIQFISLESYQDNIFCRVENVFHHNNFAEMMQEQGIGNCLPGTQTIERGEAIYHAFSDYARSVKLYGVIAFHIKYLENYQHEALSGK